MNNRYDFFREKYKELYILCNDIDLYLDVDINTALTKARIVLDKITRYMVPKSREQLTLYNRIMWLEQNKKISQSMACKMHAVRKLGNSEAHGEKVSEEDASRCIQNVYQISRWFSEEKGLIKFVNEIQKKDDIIENKQYFKKKTYNQNHEDSKSDNYRKGKVVTQNDCVVKKLDINSKARININVIGEYSRGKSTLINALVGHRVLPSAMRPTTKIITRLVNSVSASYNLCDESNSGRVVELDEETFKILNSTFIYREQMLKMKKEEIKRVLRIYDEMCGLDIKNINALNKAELIELLKHMQKHMDETWVWVENKHFLVSYPCNIPKDCCVIDWPGTNELHTGRNKEKLFSLQKENNLIIFTISILDMLSESEINCIKLLIDDGWETNLIIVANFGDQLKDDAEYQNNYSCFWEQLNILGVNTNKIKFYIVSAKQALIYRRIKNGEKLNSVLTSMAPKSLENTGFEKFEKCLCKMYSMLCGRTIG